MNATADRLGLGSPYHIGCVATDLEAACAGISATIGARWTDVQERMLDARVAGERRQLAVRFAYSKDPIHYEVIEASPGSPWTAVSDFALHHLGFWTSNLAGECVRLSELGLDCVYSGATDDHPGVARGAYFRGPAGPLIEIVDVALRPAFDELIGLPTGTNR